MNSGSVALFHSQQGGPSGCLRCTWQSGTCPWVPRAVGPSQVRAPDSPGLWDPLRYVHLVPRAVGPSQARVPGSPGLWDRLRYMHLTPIHTAVASSGSANLTGARTFLPADFVQTAAPACTWSQGCRERDMSPGRHGVRQSQLSGEGHTGTVTSTGLESLART